ncbi:cytochrome P450 [Lizonia empirigonia]|nr:cytochrome P450 [Lizonia empirigonia]
MSILTSSASVVCSWAYALLSLLGIVLYAVHNAWLHPLRQYPGPLLWRSFRIPYVVSTHKGQLHKRLKEFHTIYGPIVRIAPDELSYADSRAWKDIYTNRPGHQPFPRNKTWFKKQTPDEPHSIMSFDEASHARYRRAFANAFSEKHLRDQAPIVEGYVDLLIARLQASTIQPVDLEHLIECIAFDIGSDLSFGESFHSLHSGKVHPWVEVAKGFGKGLALIASINRYPPIERLLRYIVPKKVMEKMRSHAQMSSAMAQRRLAMVTDRPDIVTPTKRYVEAKGGIEGKEWDINLMIFVFASSETIASSLTAIFRELVEEDLTIASTSHLPYLNAVINEGLRLDPPVVLTPPRVVPTGGDTVCGRYVPAGTYVAYNQYSANRQEYNFHLPNTYLPERFLSSTPPHEFSECKNKDDMASFQPFSVGRHQCIGLKLAYAEMRIIVARVLWSFDIQLADPEDRFEWGSRQHISCGTRNR